MQINVMVIVSIHSELKEKVKGVIWLNDTKLRGPQQRKDIRRG